MGKNNRGKFAFLLSYISVLTRQTINIGPVLALLRLHRPNIVPYMGLQRADFYSLSGCIMKIGSIINKFGTPFRHTSTYVRILKVSLLCPANMFLNFLKILLKT